MSNNDKKDDDVVLECRGCFFYDDMAQEEEGYGFCRRHAPQPRPFQMASLIQLWPLVSGHNDWCGEFHDENEPFSV